MKTIKLLLVVSLVGSSLFAQGPGPGFGGRGGDGFGGWGGRGAGMKGAGPGIRKLVTGAPYSATETVTTQQLLPGNQITHTQQSTVARDGQGRVSTSQVITPRKGGTAFTVQTIFDPVAGFQYVLDSSNMTAIQTALPRNLMNGTRPERPEPAPRPNVATTSLGNQAINGQMAAGTQVTETIPAGAIGNAQPIQVTRVAWISTALQVPVQIKTSDPRFGSTSMDLTNIVPAEPNPSVFLVPAGYTVRQMKGRGPGGFDPAGGFSPKGQGTKRVRPNQ